MNIKRIFDEIASESSNLKKTEIVKRYKDNELFKRVLYMANSKRVKFYIKQIPEYSRNKSEICDLDWALNQLIILTDRDAISGNKAIIFLTYILESISSDNAYIIERIIEKDCKIGFGTRMINSVFPDLIEKTGYMGCKTFSKSLIDKILSKGNAYSQEKMDGMFMNSIIQGNEFINESRQGDPIIIENPLVFDELAQLKDCVLNGELTMFGIPRYESNGIISSLKKIAEKKNLGKDVTKEIAKLEKRHMPYDEALKLIRFTTWDILTVDEYFTRKCKRPYSERFKELQETIKDCKLIDIVETREVSTFEEVMQHFNDIQSRGGEGTVVKSMDGVWADTKPSYQVKVKKEITLDLRIIGFKYGSKGSKNENLISTIECKSEDFLLVTSPSNMDDETMEYVTENQENLMDTIVEIKCSGLSQNNKGEWCTMHPRVSKFRDDKSVANTLAECIEIDKSASLI